MEIIKAFESDSSDNEDLALDLILNKTNMFKQGSYIGKSYIKKITKFLLMRPSNPENSKFKMFIKANSKVLAKYPEDYLMYPRNGLNLILGVWKKNSKRR